MFRLTVNELAATFGTAEATMTPPSLFWRGASTRLAAVRATPGTLADLAGETMFTVPLRLNSEGPATLRAVPSPLFSARTPKPEGEVQKPWIPLEVPELATPRTPSPEAPSPRTPAPVPPPIPCTPTPLTFPPMPTTPLPKP